MTLRFLTKGQTLRELNGVISSAKVLPLTIITHAEWRNNQASELSKVDRILGNQKLIVRSSSKMEDTELNSNAGAFLSIGNVDTSRLKESIDKVFISYGRAQDSDEVLIQPMLQNVKTSGVVFSHDPNTCAPYRVINWAEGNDTSTVTAGHAGNLWYGAAWQPYPPEDEFYRPLLAMIEELLVIFGNVPIDCEFAFTENDEKKSLWLLQARRLILTKKPDSTMSQRRRLETISKKIRTRMEYHPFLVGKKTAYGVMPDWNPAEILGIRPKPLALSLYRELVTDSIWAYQRNNYGYRNLRSVPLMVDFYGLPYIDVRASFNSFIPADLKEDLADRLVDLYMDNLLAKPSLHDKIEFEIVLSCFTLDTDRLISEKVGQAFSQEEKKILSTSLLGLTNRIIHPRKGLWRVDSEKINILETRRKAILSSSLDNLEKIYWFIEDIKRYGTLPFAGLARAGFIAVQMLKSFVNLNIFSQQDYDDFLNSVSTINKKLAFDRQKEGKEKFLEVYGHLRPGTYDILSPRYDEKPDLYFDWNKSGNPIVPQESFTASDIQLSKLNKELKTLGIESTANELLDFIRSGIELRELSKFHFTRSLSDALELIAKEGAKHSISRDDMAFCNINVLRELYIAASDDASMIKNNIDLGRKRYQETRRLSLPPLITREEDIWSFRWQKTEPNFITQKKVAATVTRDLHISNLPGSLVCIVNADPGYDWLFSHSIAGLITAWGGANSHMAIRAGELGLPAIIGAGEVLYRKWSEAKFLSIDCGNRQVTVLE